MATEISMDSSARCSDYSYGFIDSVFLRVTSKKILFAQGSLLTRHTPPFFLSPPSIPRAAFELIIVAPRNDVCVLIDMRRYLYRGISLETAKRPFCWTLRFFVPVTAAPTNSNVSVLYLLLNDIILPDE